MRVTEVVRDGFVTGALLIAPLAVTVFVVDLVYGWLVAFVRPFLRMAPAGVGSVEEPVALVVLFALITGVGLVIRQGVGDGAVARFDELMGVIPGVSAIYSSARQASTAIAGPEGQFERVVLVRWPDEELRTIGFVTAETPGKLDRELPDDERDGVRYNVFVPMAPNPMGGFLAVVPEHRLVMTDLSVSEGFQLLVTSGMAGDDEFDPEELTTSPDSPASSA